MPLINKLKSSISNRVSGKMSKDFLFLANYESRKSRLSLPVNNAKMASFIIA